jgi:hypothetical protein
VYFISRLRYDKWAIKWGYSILKTLRWEHRKSVVERND